MKSLVIKFAGPLQSWGTDSHFETRDTDLYPSKSGVIGLLGASIGYRRDDDENISRLNTLSFVVRIDRPGQLLRDYHIARKDKPNGEKERNYVTNRYYLEDAIFLVGLSHEDNAFINEIEQALRFPYFTPFMGRRSAPIPADFILATSEQDALSTLKDFPWQGDITNKESIPSKLVIYCDSDLFPAQSRTNLRRDLVTSFSYKERSYGFRSETRIVLHNKYQRDLEEHDVFSALED